MENNNKNNLITVLLGTTIVVLIGIQIYNAITLSSIRNNINNTKTIIIKDIHGERKPQNNLKNKSFDKITKDELVYGSKEYFDKLERKQLKTEHEVSATGNSIPQKPSAVPSKPTVFTVPKPIAKTGKNSSTQLPVGKVLKPSPYLSPSTNQNPSPGSVANSSSSNIDLGIDALREPDFGPYMRNLQRSVKVNWNPPKGNESQKVVTSFRIAKDGSLLGANIKQSSGNKAADDAALNAVKATKFNPLPKDFQKDYVDVQFTFDYNVFSAEKK